jgi:hypothetical protein
MKIRQHLYRQPQSMEPLTTFGKMNFKFSIFFPQHVNEKKMILKIHNGASKTFGRGQCHFITAFVSTSLPIMLNSLKKSS